MKCLILAGGCGDRLWPLSRKSYPKQFMQINENRSLLQEAVVRNLPYCEEFLIVTNQSYHFIVEGQLKAFQGLRYRCFLEQEPRKTAAAIALVCMLENPSELIYVVSADTLMDGKGYQEAVLRAKELARENALAVFGIPVTGPNTGYGYIRHKGEKVLSFEEKPDAEKAVQYMESGEYLWNGGSFLFQAGVFLKELAACSPQVYEACKKAAEAVRMTGKKTVFEKKLLETIPMISVEEAVFEKSGKVKVVFAEFAWQDIGRLEDLENAPIHKASVGVIRHNCRNVTVINQSGERLVVANGLEDAIVVNTTDAVYIGKKGCSGELKEIMRQNGDAFGTYFENSQVNYRPYGKYQVLSVAQGYRVKKVTIYPGCSISMHRHDHRSEHWSVVEGSARICLWNGEEGGPVMKEYGMNESIFVPVGVPHMVSNPTDKELIIIEVAIGQTVAEEDIVRLGEKRDDQGKEPVEPVVRLLPAFKDYLWGGSRLKEQFGKQSDLERIAESWELSAHEAGQSVIAEGRHKGMLFGEYLERIGRDAWGWKCRAFEWFPILVKLLDARESLSIQVHPDDEYALTREKEYGKNEMWYILDCEPGAAIYHGFDRKLTAEEIRERIRQGTLTEVLKKVPVHKGDAVFIPAGTVHAIQGGVLVCEIQQNSNSTYRLYDYDRTDSYGNKRPLHVEKALEVLGKGPSVGEDVQPEQSGEYIEGNGFKLRQIASCKYFETLCYQVEEQADLESDESSFLSLLFVEGEGLLQAADKVLPFKKGDSFFVPAGKRHIHISGPCRCIVTHV